MAVMNSARGYVLKFETRYLGHNETLVDDLAKAYVFKNRGDAIYMRNKYRAKKPRIWGIKTKEMYIVVTKEDVD